MAIPHSKLVLLRALLILAAGCWVFAPALRGDWLMDDDMYLTQNALLGDPARLWKIWFAPGSLIEYYPIEATVQAVQWHFWHLQTLGYHVTNLALHLTGALLVWRLLAKFGLRYAWLGGFLFAIHPVVVESVAWISELKNTLSLPPFLLAMCAWIDYDAHRRPRDYGTGARLLSARHAVQNFHGAFPVRAAALRVVETRPHRRGGRESRRAVLRHLARARAHHCPRRRLVPRGAPAGHGESAHR